MKPLEIAAWLLVVLVFMLGLAYYCSIDSFDHLSDVSTVQWPYRRF